MTTQKLEGLVSLVNEKFNEGTKIISIDGWTGAVNHMRAVKALRT